MSDVTGAWHPDPEQPGMLRWWDGTQWTEQRTPAVSAQGMSPTPGPSAPNHHKRNLVLVVVGGLVVLIVVLAAIGSGSSGGTKRVSFLNVQFLFEDALIDCTSTGANLIEEHSVDLPSDLKDRFQKVADEAPCNGDAAVERFKRDLSAAEDELDRRCPNVRNSHSGNNASFEGDFVKIDCS